MLEKLQTRDQWNDNRLISSIKVFKDFNNVDEAEREYYKVLAKRIKILNPKFQLSGFYHPYKAQKKGELLLLPVGTCLATYALCKYLK